MEACLPLIHDSGISVNPCGNADGSIFVPGLFTGSLGWEMLTIKALSLIHISFLWRKCMKNAQVGSLPEGRESGTREGPQRTKDV